MTIAILIVIAVSNLVFLAAGYRMGKGQSPVANPWPNLSRFVGGKKEPPKEPKELPQEKF